MSADFLRVLYFIFHTCWRFATSWYIPGTTVTPASWAFFSLVLLGVVKYLKSYVGGGDNDGV